MAIVTSRTGLAKAPCSISLPVTPTRYLAADGVHPRMETGDALHVETFADPPEQISSDPCR